MTADWPNGCASGRIWAGSEQAMCSAGIPGPLTLIQRSGGFYRFYVKTGPLGTELAVASPGVDEVSLIADLIAAIYGRSRSSRLYASRPSRVLAVVC